MSRLEKFPRLPVIEEGYMRRVQITPWRSLNPRRSGETRLPKPAVIRVKRSDAGGSSVLPSIADRVSAHAKLYRDLGSGHFQRPSIAKRIGVGGVT